MSSQVEQLHEIAADCRRNFEVGEVDINLLSELYEKHIPQPSRGYSWAIPTLLPYFPRHNCTLASLYLLNKIEDGELIKTRYKGLGHTVLGAGNIDPSELVIVDITSDQFGGPPIYVGPLIHPWSLT